MIAYYIDMSDILLHVAGIVLQAVTAGGVAYMIVRKPQAKTKAPAKPRITPGYKIIEGNPNKSNKTVYLHDKHDDKLISKVERQAGVDDEW